MPERLPPKWMCSVSRDLLKFREISDNVSETVQNRNSCRLIGNHMWPIKSNGIITGDLRYI